LSPFIFNKQKLNKNFNPNGGNLIRSTEYIGFSHLSDFTCTPLDIGLSAPSINPECPEESFRNLASWSFNKLSQYENDEFRIDNSTQAMPIAYPEDIDLRNISYIREHLLNAAFPQKDRSTQLANEPRTSYEMSPFFFNHLFNWNLGAVVDPNNAEPATNPLKIDTFSILSENINADPELKELSDQVSELFAQWHPSETVNVVAFQLKFLPNGDHGFQKPHFDIQGNNLWAASSVVPKDQIPVTPEHRYWQGIDGSYYLYSTGNNNPEDKELKLLDMDSGQWKVLSEDELIYPLCLDDRLSHMMVPSFAREKTANDKPGAKFTLDSNTDSKVLKDKVVYTLPGTWTTDKHMRQRPLIEDSKTALNELTSEYGAPNGFCNSVNQVFFNVFYNLTTNSEEK